jgi:hypothetical protein
MGRRPAGSPGTDVLAVRAAAWLEQHSREQGVSVTVSDPLTIAAVASVLAQGRSTGVKRDSSKRL